MPNPISLSRRRLLHALGGAATLSLPCLTLPRFVRTASAAPSGDSILILVELAGGNDGLNSVIPIRDPAYRALRPTIGLSRRDTISLDTETGLHPSLRAMADLWHDGALQIVEGVGYPNPNRSHFRSIEIWNSGQGAESKVRDGWIASAFGGAGFAARDADGLVLGGDFGPLDGDGRFAAIREEEVFRDTIHSLPDRPHAVRPRATTPLDHVLRTYESARVTGDAILRRLEASPARRLHFPDSTLGQQLHTAARLLDAGVDVPVLKVVQDGYDTHDGQPDQHSDLLDELSEAIGAFATAMQQIGLWDRITLVTYSEFGRTAHENASGGTDHGTAAPLFVAGGRVRGGRNGQRPSLERLVENDLVHTTDYRSVYNAILGDLWGIDGGLSTRDAVRLQLLRV